VTDRTYRILLVEDNDMIRDMFVYGVNKYFSPRVGHVQVGLADNGEQAWRMISAGRWDLAIVDCYLPVLGGASLVRRVRASSLSMPILGISGGGAEARDLMLDAGVDLFLAKPIVLRDLLSTLERLTSDERSTHP
jgi:DNA-binding response OmpR family regulator